jgi:transposase
VFGLGLATKIFVAIEAVDMRKGFEGLYGLVRDQLGQDPLSGYLFLFSNRTRTRLKALVWDGSGLWVCAKRLEKGRFRWPAASEKQRSASQSATVPHQSFQNKNR